MRLLGYGVCLVLVSACGPSLKGEEPKSTNDILAEEMEAAEQQEAESEAQGQPVMDDETLESDQKKKWDQRQAEIELKRAARSAATCHGSIPDEKKAEQPKGTADVVLMFSNHGSVKSATISAPFEGTEVGKCALRAMKAVIVPPYSGSEQTVEWKVDLTGEQKKEGEEEEK